MTDTKPIANHIADEATIAQLKHILSLLPETVPDVCDSIKVAAPPKYRWRKGKLEVIE